MYKKQIAKICRKVNVQCVYKRGGMFILMIKLLTVLLYMYKMFIKILHQELLS